MALRFDGVNDFVTFGQASGPAGLGVTTFTLETWFRRDGAGIATSTGTGGVVAVPLITKGMAQAEGNDLDMNYFLGIRATDGVLVADFEDTATGLNHPVAGTTPIANGAWYHAAVTYDGTTWRLYLNGALETQLVVGSFTPEFEQHPARGHRHGARLRRHGPDRPDRGRVRRRDGRSAHLERGAQRRGHPGGDGRSRSRARPQVCSAAGRSTKPAARRPPTRRAAA